MISNWANLLARRDLVRELVVGDLRATSAESKLGWLWWLLDPLLLMCIYWVFIVILFGREKYAPYPIFIGCALLPWKHLSACVSSGSRILRAHQGVIKTVPFPTMALPISMVLSQFVYFLAGFVMLLVGAVALGCSMTVTLVQVPALMALQLVLVAGLAMAVSCLGALFRDVANLSSHVLRMAFYLSPGIYGLDLLVERFGQDSRIISLYMLNPFAIIFEGYRGALFDPAWLAPHHWVVLAVESLLMLTFGYLIYQRYDRRVIKFI